MCVFFLLETGTWTEHNKGTQRTQRRHPPGTGLPRMPQFSPSRLESVAVDSFRLDVFKAADSLHREESTQPVDRPIGIRVRQESTVKVLNAGNAKHRAVSQNVNIPLRGLTAKSTLLVRKLIWVAQVVLAI